MSISFNGIGEVIATFKVEDMEALNAGDAVVITGDGEIGLGADGEQICGVVIGVEEDGCAAVQMDGLVQVNYSGSTAPETGWELLCVDGTGCVKAVESGGVSCLVVSVDEEAKTAVIKL